MRYRRGHAQAPHPPPMPHQKITTCPLLKTTVALREAIFPFRIESKQTFKTLFTDSKSRLIPL